MPDTLTWFPQMACLFMSSGYHAVIQKGCYLADSENQSTRVMVLASEMKKLLYSSPMAHSRCAMCDA